MIAEPTKPPIEVFNAMETPPKVQSYVEEDQNIK